MAAKCIIPEIDISALFNNDPLDSAEKKSVRDQIKYACESIGFMTITGHNVPQDVVTSMVEAAREFMYFPKEVKLSSASQKWNPSSKNKYRGYWPSSVFGKEGLDITDYRYKGDLNGVFHLYEENIFPKEVSEKWLKSVHNYYDHLHQLGVTLLTNFFECFSPGRNLAEQALERPYALLTLRINYYPTHKPQDEAIETSPEGLKLACETHKDGAPFTILYQDCLGGLQVQSPHDLVWHDVPFNPNAFVLNTGVGLQRLTNDHWQATNHRVLFNLHERISIPAFMEFKWDFPLDPKYLCPDEQPKYEIERYGDYINNSNKNFKEYQRE